MRRFPFSRADRAVAAIEFALVTPVMAIMLLGVYNIGTVLILKQQVYNAAHAIAVNASTLAVQLDKSTTLTPAQAQLAMSSIYAEMPWVRSGAAPGFKVVTLTSVAFANSNPACNPAIATCVYTPNVAWSASYMGGVVNSSAPNNTFYQILRPCGPQGAVAPDYAIDPNHEYNQLKTLNVNNPDPVVSRRCNLSVFIPSAAGHPVDVSCHNFS